MFQKPFDPMASVLGLVFSLQELEDLTMECRKKKDNYRCVVDFFKKRTQNRQRQKAVGSFWEGNFSFPKTKCWMFFFSKIC